MADTDLLSSTAAVNSGALNSASTANAKTSANAAQVQLSSDVNFFLKMLTTQLKNQDPTQPLDTNQFTQQIAQYSGVQQQVTTNANLEKLLAASRQSSVTTAVSYLGREVETKGNSGEVVGGQGAFSYMLPRAAATVKLTIKDAAGSVVFSGNGDNKEGRNLVVWDGKNSANGNQEPDGRYTITVEATDASGKAITVETRAVATIGGVETETNGNVLLTTAKNARVNFTDVLAVREPTRAALDG